MKAERRHQLQNNDLTRQLESLPEWLMRHASKIMLTITAFLLVWFIIRYRMNATAQKHVDLAQAMRDAREGTIMLRSYDLQPIGIDNIARYRQTGIARVSAAIETVLTQADSPDDAAYRAQAILFRGDLNWTLANLIELPGATTQPALQLPHPREDYLKNAEDAYKDVVTVYSQQVVAWTAAQMGLAAIAETRHDWDAAKKVYGAIIARPDVPKSFSMIAQAHVQMIPVISAPKILGNYPPKAEAAPIPSYRFSEPTLPGISQPTTEPAALEPAPASQPAMEPTTGKS